MIKDLKLSDAMIKMITGAEYHEVRVNGEIVHRGYMIAGRAGTVVALMDRGLCTACTIEHHGMHWLTESGMQAWAWITGNDLPASEVEDETVDTVHAVSTGMADGQIERAWDEAYGEIAAHETSESQWDDVMAGELHYASMEPDSIRDYGDDDESHDLPGDAERAWDAENAALERADIESEYRAEAEASEASWVPVEIINADDLMYRTRKGIWLSAGYFATMRRMRDLRLRELLAFKAAQKLIRERYSGGRVTFLDEMLADGKASFTAVDKTRRTILAICAPTLGSKVKPSSKKRNKR